MLHRFLGFCLFVVTVVCAASPCLAQPWGYFWSFGTSRLHPLSKTSISVGRSTQNDLVLRESRISRRHAVLRKTEDGVVLIDQGSTNNTRLNGEKLVPGREYVLSAGDLVIFAFERLVFHENTLMLWDDVFRKTLIGSFVRLNVRVYRRSEAEDSRSGETPSKRSAKPS